MQLTFHILGRDQHEFQNTGLHPSRVHFGRIVWHPPQSLLPVGSLEEQSLQRDLGDHLNIWPLPRDRPCEHHVHRRALTQDFQRRSRLPLLQ